MRRTIVYNPEDAASFVVGWPGHDLLDQAIKRGDPIGGFTATEDAGLVDIQGRQIGPGATTLVFVFHEDGKIWFGGQRRMLAATCLDTGFLIGGDDEFVFLQRLAFPDAFIEVEDASRLGSEVGIAREDPTAVIPGPNGVLVQPSPDGASGNTRDQAGLANLTGDVGSIPVRQRNVMSDRQLAGERLYLHHQLWGKMLAGGQIEGALPGRASVLRRTACATC